MTKAAPETDLNAQNSSAQEALALQNKRWSMRRNSRLAGLITVNAQQGTPVSCIVSDTSSTGAKLDCDPRVPSSKYAFAALPDKFWLFIKVDRAQVYCEVVWHQDGAMGVRFISPMQIKPRETSKRSINKSEKSKTKSGWPFSRAS